MYRRLTVVAIWSLIIAGAAYLFFFEPGKSGFSPGCPFRFITCFSCTGSGTTRALHQILHAHFLTAFPLNPLLALAIPILLLARIRYSVIATPGGVPRANALPAPYIYAIFFVI